MIIGGRKINFNQTKNETNKLYYSSLISNTVQTLNNTRGVKRFWRRFSKNTDTLYFYIKLKNVENKLIISLRTHQGKTKTNHIDFYLPIYYDMKELQKHIRYSVETQYDLMKKNRNYVVDGFDYDYMVADAERVNKINIDDSKSDIHLKREKFRSKHIEKQRKRYRDVGNVYHLLRELDKQKS